MEILRCPPPVVAVGRFGHAYDADLALWNFSPHGPFSAVEELKSSQIMQPLADGLRFTVVSERASMLMLLKGTVGIVWTRVTATLKEEDETQLTHPTTAVRGGTLSLCAYAVGIAPVKVDSPYPPVGSCRLLAHSMLTRRTGVLGWGEGAPLSVRQLKCCVRRARIMGACGRTCFHCPTIAYHTLGSCAFRGLTR